MQHGQISHLEERAEVQRICISLVAFLCLCGLVRAEEQLIALEQIRADLEIRTTALRADAVSAFQMGFLTVAQKDEIVDGCDGIIGGPNSPTGSGNPPHLYEIALAIQGCYSPNIPPQVKANLVGKISDDLCVLESDYQELKLLFYTYSMP